MWLIWFLLVCFSWTKVLLKHTSVRSFQIVSVLLLAPTVAFCLIQNNRLTAVTLRPQAHGTHYTALHTRSWPAPPPTPQAPSPWASLNVSVVSPTCPRAFALALTTPGISFLFDIYMVALSFPWELCSKLTLYPGFYSDPLCLQHHFLCLSVSASLYGALIFYRWFSPSNIVYVYLRAGIFVSFVCRRIPCT